METIVPPQRLEFFLRRLLDYIIRTHVSYDKAFKAIVDRYPVPKWLLSSFYKIGYYTVLYYHGLRWVAARKGYGVKRGAAITFFRDIGFSVKRLEKILDEETKYLSISKRLSIRYSFPEYIVKDLMMHIDYRILEKYLKALNERRVWFRTNLLKISVGDAIKCLKNEGVYVEKDTLIPFMLLVSKPRWTQPSKLGCVRKGYVIPQDKASAAVSVITSFISKTDLLDACSAPGNKLSLVISLEKNISGIRYISMDKSLPRLESTIPFMKRQNTPMYKVLFINTDSSEIIFRTKFDRTLIDAPCSGSGAVPSDPAVKIAIERRGKLEYYTEIQYKILVNMLKQSKIVIYAVCSIHPAEGEELVERIVLENKAVPVEVKLPLKKAYPGYTISDTTYRMYPHTDFSQGFYIAVLRSKLI